MNVRFAKYEVFRKPLRGYSRFLDEGTDFSPPSRVISCAHETFDLELRPGALDVASTASGSNADWFAATSATPPGALVRRSSETRVTAVFSGHR